MMQGTGNMAEIQREKPSVTARIEALEGLDLAGLRRVWQQELRESSPSALRSTDIMRRLLAWKMQAKAFGYDLSAPAKRRLTEIASALIRDAGHHPRNLPTLQPGTILLRHWRGNRYEVTVLDQGFLWQDRHYNSLSAIARAITGSHHSGPRFFGLDENRKGNDVA